MAELVDGGAYETLDLTPSGPGLAHITRTSHYERFTMSGTGYNENALLSRPQVGLRALPRGGENARAEHCVTSTEESTLLYSLSYKPPYSPVQNKRK